MTTVQTRPGRRRRLAVTSVLVFAAAIAPVAVGSHTEAATPTELFISEYVQGSTTSQNALEIYNGTGTGFVFGGINDYYLEIWQDGATVPTTIIELTGAIGSKSTFVIGDQSAPFSAIGLMADQLADLSAYDGNDLIVLLHGNTLIDSIGQAEVVLGPGGFWGSGDVTTRQHTLRRKPEVLAGDTDAFDAYDPAIEWDGFPVDTIDDLGTHVVGSAGSVDATVVVYESVACLQVSTGAVDFGVLPLGAEQEPATPDVVVTNCSDADETLLARGSDAVGDAGATWSLVGGGVTCADMLGPNQYRLELASADLNAPFALARTNATVQTLAAGAASSHTAQIWTACPASTGGGQTMSMTITYVATL